MDIGHTGDIVYIYLHRGAIVAGKEVQLVLFLKIFLLILYLLLSICIYLTFQFSNMSLTFYKIYLQKSRFL